MTPEYIVENWTEEKLNLMLEKLVARKVPDGTQIPKQERDVMVSDKALFGQLGKKMKVVNDGNNNR